MNGDRLEYSQAKIRNILKKEFLVSEDMLKQRSIEAVSYTHLDVYKRQVLNCLQETETKARNIRAVMITACLLYTSRWNFREVYG